MNEITNQMTVQIVGSAAGKSLEVPIQTLNDASAKYRAFLDENGFGSRDGGCCYIKHGGKIVAHVSHNGKVWEGKKYVPDAKPIFTP